MGQSVVSSGVLPEVNVSYRWSPNWRVTSQIESMQQVFRKDGAESFRSNYDYIRTDFTNVLSYKLSPEWTLASGYLLRFTQGELVHRWLQQISSAHQKSGLRIGHRLRTDQTFEKSETTEFRLRYRFSAEVPLKGLSVNDNEWYLIASTEMLGSLQRRDLGYEHRFVSSLGYYFNSSNKIEGGIDYRLDRFLEGTPRHRIWWTISYFLNL